MSSITVVHPVDEQEAELSKNYAEEVYNNDGWQTTQYYVTRIHDQGKWKDILRPKHNDRKDLRNSVEAYLLSFKFQPDPDLKNTFTPPKDVGLRSVPGNRNVIKYLSETFENPRDFLYVLAKRGGFLSGSRALELWVPGVADEDSDWDIYVNATALTEIMVVLSKCGVRWLAHEAKRVDESLEKRKGCWVQRCLLRYIEAPDKENLEGLVQSNLYAIYLEAWSKNLLKGHGAVWAEKKGGEKGVAVSETRTVRREDEDETEHIDDMEAEYEGMLVLNGRIQAKDGKKQNVQLISNRNRTSCFTWVANFYASPPQCFIGGWYAVHMYPGATRARKMMIWTLPSQNPESVGKALDKYRERGFSDAYHTDTRWRSLIDEFSSFTDFSHEVLNVDAQPGWWRDKKYCNALEGQSVDEIIEREKNTQADESWLINRRADLVNLRWRLVTGHTRAAVSALFAENRAELDWAL